jgi:hypothetical protein
MKIPRRDPSGGALSLWRRSAPMVSIDDLVRPKADFDPETIAVLCAALDETWDRLLQSGSECARPAYARAMRKRQQGSSGMAVAPLALPEITAADGGKNLPVP